MSWRLRRPDLQEKPDSDSDGCPERLSDPHPSLQEAGAQEGHPQSWTNCKGVSKLTVLDERIMQIFFDSDGLPKPRSEV